jgi:hypothetical protein
MGRLFWCGARYQNSEARHHFSVLLLKRSSFRNLQAIARARGLLYVLVVYQYAPCHPLICNDRGHIAKVMYRLWA